MRLCSFTVAAAALAGLAFQAGGAPLPGSKTMRAAAGPGAHQIHLKKRSGASRPNPWGSADAAPGDGRPFHALRPPVVEVPREYFFSVPYNRLGYGPVIIRPSGSRHGD